MKIAMLAITQDRRNRPGKGKGKLNRSDAAQEIKSRYAEYLQPAKKKVQGKTTYICPLCGNGKGKTGDGLSIDPGSNGTQLKCFKCGFYGDIIDLYKQEHNCDDAAAFSALYERFNITIDESTRTDGKPPKKAKATNTPTETQKAENGQNENAEKATPNFLQYYMSCKEHITDQAAKDYLSIRGISEETAARFWLGYDPKTRFLIIPAANSFYIARNTDSKSDFRYNNPKGASIELFNIKALYNDNARPVFIVEGAIDALSIIEIGGEAVALNSTSNARKLLEELKQKPTENALILCLDNDAAGTRASSDLATGLQELKIPFISTNISGKYKDPNEALTSDKEAFIAAVKRAERATQAQGVQGMYGVTASDYLSSRIFETDISYFKAYKDRKMGLHNKIDKYLTLYPGLAVLGGASSLGKTTFAVNMIDKLLDNGETVLYFSLEQLPIEIITKSLARRLYEVDPGTKLTNIDIKNGATCDKLEQIKKEYASKASRYEIITGSFRVTAADITSYVETYIKKHEGCTPIVIIDYLQLIAPPEGFKGSVREYTDENIKALKDMQKKNGLFVVVISSFNRSSSYEPISYEAFKETGMIEYTCDYVWGLQLSILDAENTDFYTMAGKKGGRTERPLYLKRKLVNEAQAETPKGVEFVSLKSRNGKQFYKAFFDYYPAHDYYTEDTDGVSTLWQDAEGTPWDDVATVQL